MTEAVVKFVPRAAVDATARVLDFIHLAQNEITALIPNDGWQETVWDVTTHFTTKGATRRARRFIFCNAEAELSHDGSFNGDLLHADFINFAKAYCRYKHATSPVAYENQRKRLNGLQFIEAAFRSLGSLPRIENCNPTVLNTAITLAKDSGGAARHYQFAVYIEQVHRFCLEHRFYAAPFQWKHGVRKPKDGNEELGEKARQVRSDRLPSPEAFSALAHVFRNATSHIDRVLSAVCAICCSVPIRAHEVLQLREDCEVFEKRRDVEASAPDESVGTEAIAYGLRVWPGKGNPPQVKWVPTLMASVVQEAVARLRDECRPMREVAAWYEKNPDDVWLPPELKHLRGSEWIAISDLMTVLGSENRNSVLSWVKFTAKARYRSITRKDGVEEISFADAEKWILAALPPDFPWFNGDEGQRYSETLILLPLRAGARRRTPYPCVVDACSVQKFEQWLSGHEYEGGKQQSIFKRFGFTERDGSPIEITTHSFRHWLNTIAQLRGMSDLDIAKWSGRDPSQNQAYNHVTPEELVSQVRGFLEENEGIGPVFDAARLLERRKPIDRDEFLKAQIGSAHVTDFGVCIHDYSLLPCQTHGDCLGCAENVFVKGEKKHLERIEQRLALARHQLRESTKAEHDGLYGADRWTQDHLANIARMQEMIAYHRNETIPDGTVINLEAKRTDNDVAMAIRDRQARDTATTTTPTAPDADEVEAFKSMWDV